MLSCSKLIESKRGREKGKKVVGEEEASLGVGG